MGSPAHYRYRDILGERGMLIIEEEFRVIKETPQGYWVQPAQKGACELTEEMVSRLVSKATRPSSVRFVLKFSSRRYCYPDKSVAMRAFMCRKEYQIKHAKTSLAKAKQSLQAAKTMLEVGDVFPRDKWCNSIMAGMPPEFDNWVFY